MSSINAISNQIDAVYKFETDLHNLLEVMGKADVRVLPAGSAVNVYKEGTALSPTAAAKGALISVDGAVPVLDHAVTLTWDKRREIAPFEDIQTQGYDVCVGGTADTLLKRSAATIRTKLCNAIKGAATTATQGATAQAAMANAVASVMENTADASGEILLFMSPAVWAQFAGVSAITTQEAMGLKYVENFMGIGNAIILPGLDGKVYATTSENINIVAAKVDSMANVQTDPSGCIGVSISDAPEYAGVQVCVYNGVSVFLNVTANAAKAAIGA